jgi:hypothetical protein
MKKTILLTIILCLSSFALFGQKTIFIVDNQTIEDFDGSILKGKTILDYKVTTTGKGRNAFTVHSISTMPTFQYLSPTMPDSLRFTPLIEYQAPLEYIYMIDGKEINDGAAFRSLSPNTINSVSIKKEGNTDIIQVETKKAYDMKELFVKGLPGVKIAEDGSVTVNGKPVHSIVINGQSYPVQPSENEE